MYEKITADQIYAYSLIALENEIETLVNEKLGLTENA